MRAARHNRHTPGDRVDAALAGLELGAPSSASQAGRQLTRAEATQLVPVGTAAVQETDAGASIPAAVREAFGLGPSVTLTRETAMRVPAIRRGRALIAGTIGTLDLVQHRRASDGTVVPVPSTLLEQLDDKVTPAYTLTWTVDDLMFRPCSWWRVTRRAARSEGSFPLNAERLAPSRVLADVESGKVYVDGQEARDQDIIRFDSPDEGLLAYGGPIIRLAHALIAAGWMTANDEVPSGILRPSEGAPELSDEDIVRLLNDWASARSERRTALLNKALDYEAIASAARDRQLAELSELVSSELARLLNLPASRIGAPQGSGMTYTNTEGDRRDLIDTTLAPYMAVVSQRLSMPDVTPRGNRVSFDLTAFVRGSTTDLVAAGAQAVEAGLVSKAEVRQLWLGLPAQQTGAPE